MNHGQPPAVGVGGMPMVGISLSSMMASAPQQMPGMMSQQQNPFAMLEQPQQLTDNITKVKSLMVPLRDSLSTTLKQAAQLVQHNNMTDNGNLKGVDNNNPPPRFDKNLVEFYSICDQIEMHLKIAIQWLQHNSASERFLPESGASTRIEPIMPPKDDPISYPQYLSAVRTQIAYTKDIHDTLICAATVVKNDYVNE